MARISLTLAERVADVLCKAIAPFCERQMVVGSIRREKDRVKDIDLLIIPAVRGAVDIVGWARSQTDGTRLLKMKKSRIEVSFRGVRAEIWLATEETWWTLVLVRTGSAKHNINMATAAKKRGWKFKANGMGLIDAQGERVAGDSEESFFEAFGWPYREPRDRN